MTKHKYSVMIYGATLSAKGETILYRSMQKALDAAFPYTKAGMPVIVNDEEQTGYFNAWRVRYLSDGMGCEATSIDPDQEQAEYAKDYDAWVAAGKPAMVVQS